MYRTLWSAPLQAWIAVPETARAAGKSSKSSKGSPASRTGTTAGTATLLAALALSLAGMPLSASAQAAITASGDVNPVQTGSAWELGNTSLDVGNTQFGSLRITGGASIGLSPSGSFNVARSGGSSGEVTIADAGSTLTVGRDLDVGSQGDGRMTIQSGAQVSSNTGYIGRLANSSGSILVDGTGSQWRTSSFLYVGNNGYAELTVANGGTVAASGVIDVGRNASTIAGQPQDMALITGAGSTLATERSLNIGHQTGNGSLTVTDGAQALSQEGYIGRDAAASGMVTISDGGQWQLLEQLRVGFEGSGEMHIRSGGTVTTGSDSTIASQTGSVGAALVSDQGALWRTNGALTIGQAGSGTLQVSAGGLVLADRITLGAEAGSNGQLLVASGGAIETRQIT